MAELAAEHPWQGLTVATTAGRPVGQVKDVWLSDIDRQPEWLVLAGGPAGRGRWMPVEGTVQIGDALQTGFPLDQIKAAPRPTTRQKGIEPAAMETLCIHYGLKPRRRPKARTGRLAGDIANRGGPGSTGGRATAGRRGYDPLGGAAALRRSVRPRERVRLVKRVVTEEAELPVKLRREELVLERVPFEPGSAPDLETNGELRDSQEQIGEVILYEEQAVITKRLVPKERVRLVKTTVTDQQQVKEQVRREQVRAERKSQK